MRFSLCFCLLLIAIVANGQDYKFSAGITGGFIASDVSRDDPRDHDNDFHKAGYIAGGFVQRPMSENGKLRLEINLIQKGTLQQPDSTGFGYYRLELNYIEIPFLYQYHFIFTTAKKPITN